MTAFAKGFRPFFLISALFAVIVIPLTLLVMAGQFTPAGPFKAHVWHAHEMLFGYTIAVIAGFLLTAVTNWAGRPTIVGGPLAAVAALWVAARLTLITGPSSLAAGLDLAFLPIIAVGIGRPIALARDKRNMGLVGLLVALWVTNLTMYLDVWGVFPGVALPAAHAGVHLIAIVILVITGRVVPMFTGNATKTVGLANDRKASQVAIGFTALFALLQFWPSVVITPWVGFIAAGAILYRQRNWGFKPALGNPLLWVLHFGHLAIGVGIALEAFTWWRPQAFSPAMHMITVGGIGALTIGMMARVAMGHTGRPIKPSKPMTLAFGSVFLAALVRVFGPIFWPAQTTHAWWTAAGFWVLAFAIYVVLFTKILTTPRADGKPG